MLVGAGGFMIMGMNHGWQRLLGVGVAALLMAGSHAFAQVEYELGPDGFEAVRQPAPGSPAGALQAARSALAGGDAARAERLASDWLEANPYHPLRAEAMVLRGDAQVAQGNYYLSLFDYERVCREYPGSPAFVVALERELEVARIFTNGTKRKVWGMRWLSAEAEAEELYIRIQERAPGGKLAETAGIELADWYYKDREMWLSSEMYDVFLENNPNSLWASHAMQRRAESHMARFKGPKFDATGLLEAERHLVTFQKAFPVDADRAGAAELMERIDDSLAEKDLIAARWYESQQKMVSAKFMYRRVAEGYPRSAAARKAAARLAELGERIDLGALGEGAGPARPGLSGGGEPTVRRTDWEDGQPAERPALPDRRATEDLPVVTPGRQGKEE